jgi:hypothetical protein
VADAAITTRQLSDEDRKRLPILMNRAQQGDKKALEEASRLLTDHRLWHALSNLAQLAQHAWLDAATGDNLGSCSLSMTPMHAIGQANPGGSCRLTCLVRASLGASRS